jgi:hypothetical protein
LRPDAYPLNRFRITWHYMLPEIDKGAIIEQDFDATKVVAQAQRRGVLLTTTQVLTRSVLGGFGGDVG